jgi:hypothetical protein
MNSAPGQGRLSPAASPRVLEIKPSTVMFRRARKRTDTMPDLLPAQPAATGSLLTGPGTGDREVVQVTWPQMQVLVSQIAGRAGRDGAPQTLVAVLRGGALPAIWLSHRLRVRDVRAVEVVHTVDDSIHAAKLSEPVAENPASLGDLTGRDVLVVDDVAGTGQTLAAAARLAAQAGAARLRTAVCVVNEDNWAGHLPAEDVVTYIGAAARGWIVFPWEHDGH